MAPRSRRLAAVSIAAASFALLVGAGCRKGPAAATTWPGAPVILVSIDTVRSDHTPMYGDSSVEMPVLTAFRNEAILFEKAYSHVPLTLPSHASILTGTLPAVHGLRDNLGYTLSPKVETLAQILARQGYAAGGAISSVVLNGASGIGRGFAYYEESVEPREANEALGRVQRPGGETEALLAGWLESLPAERPVFAFLHLYEPHTPYEPPEPWATRYRDRPYDGELAYSDELVGRFFERLRKRGIWDRALVIVLSDHGEGLGEHGEDEHGILLYRWALQVPLLVKLPGGERGGTSVSAPVTLSDVFATVVKGLAVPGVTIPEGTVSLLDVGSGAVPAERRIYAETLFPRIHFGWSDLASLIDGPYQYIEAPRPELYDLTKDPGETVDLAPGAPQAFRTLRIELEKRRAAFAAPGAIDPEEARKLASLGYLSSGATAGTGPLADPKDVIGVVRALKKGSGLFHARRYDEAITIFQNLLEQYPGMLDVWDLYSQSLQKLGQNEKALAALKKGVGLSPGGPGHYVLAVANLCLKLGRLDEAAKNAEIAKGGGDPNANDLLARIYLAQRNLAAAETAAREWLAARPSRRAPYLVLARIAVERNDLPAALELVEKARALSGGSGAHPITGLHWLRGDILGRMERLPEAEAEFQEEIRLFPESLDAWSSLTALYAAQGRLADVRRTVREWLSPEATAEAYASAARTLTVVGDREGADRVLRAGARRFPSDVRFRRGA